MRPKVSDATKAQAHVPSRSARETELKGLSGRYTLHAVAWTAAPG